MATLGVIFPPDLPPEQLRSVAIAADASGLEELWLWEDCFSESGIAAAAAVLGWTERLRVGIGLLPVPLRNVALTAMELATLERLFPGRLVAGIGHGVLEWMDQVGALAGSPMTMLREYTVALTDLLDGLSVTTAGRYVRLTDVRLAWPPDPAPPLLVGAVRERTVALAGELADGVILTGDTTPQQVQDATALIGATPGRRPGRFQTVVFVEVQDQPAVGIAAKVRDHLHAGATTVALHHVSDAQSLEEFVRLVAEQVCPLLG